jgi:hypothetical protein
VSRRASCSSLLVCACAALSLAAPAGAQSSIAFVACHPRQVVVRAAGLQCGTLDVPFDHADPALASIGLAVQRVPASAPRVGVIDLLAGGPGQPALPAFEELLAPLAHEAALRGFELMAFDQRGTGQSQEFQCPPGRLKRFSGTACPPISVRAAPRSAPRARSTQARNLSKISTRCAERLGARPCRCSPSPTARV